MNPHILTDQHVSWIVPQIGPKRVALTEGEKAIWRHRVGLSSAPPLRGSVFQSVRDLTYPSKAFSRHSLDPCTPLYLDHIRCRLFFKDGENLKFSPVSSDVPRHLIKPQKERFQSFNLKSRARVGLGLGPSLNGGSTTPASGGFNQ